MRFLAAANRVQSSSQPASARTKAAKRCCSAASARVKKRSAARGKRVLRLAVTAPKSTRALAATRALASSAAVRSPACAKASRLTSRGEPAHDDSALYGLFEALGPTGSTCQNDCPAAFKKSTNANAES